MRYIPLRILEGFTALAQMEVNMLVSMKDVQNAITERAKHISDLFGDQYESPIRDAELRALDEVATDISNLQARD
jgi:hypothetical protein